KSSNGPDAGTGRSDARPGATQGHLQRGAKARGARPSLHFVMVAGQRRGGEPRGKRVSAFPQWQLALVRLDQPGRDRRRACAGGDEMTRFFLRRLLALAPVALGVATLTFALIHLVPGDPVIAMLGENATPIDVATMRRQLGLDRPLMVQYAAYLEGL